MKYQDALIALLNENEAGDLYKLVRDIAGPEYYISAGFIRNMVWDHMHHIPFYHNSDIDVICFKPNGSKCDDKNIQALLQQNAGQYDWSAKNQSRMHTRNGDDAYMSLKQAMSHWPEIATATATATAVAVRLTPHNVYEIIAPFGLNDLFQGRIRPTENFVERKRDIFDQRISQKQWLQRWPNFKAGQI